MVEHRDFTAMLVPAESPSARPDAKIEARVTISAKVPLGVAAQVPRAGVTSRRDGVGADQLPLSDLCILKTLST